MLSVLLTNPCERTVAIATITSLDRAHEYKPLAPLYLESVIVQTWNIKRLCKTPKFLHPLRKNQALKISVVAMWTCRNLCTHGILCNWTNLCWIAMAQRISDMMKETLIIPPHDTHTHTHSEQHESDPVFEVWAEPGWESCGTREQNASRGTFFSSRLQGAGGQKWSLWEDARWHLTSVTACNYSGFLRAPEGRERCQVQVSGVTRISPYDTSTR